MLPDGRINNTSPIYVHFVQRIYENACNFCYVAIISKYMFKLRERKFQLQIWSG
jgi:hypothetical protein